MNKSTQVAVAVAVAALAFFWMLFKPTPITAPREEIWPVMGTVASLRTPASERTHFPLMATIAKDTFEEVNAYLSVYNPTSELARLNQAGKLENASTFTRFFLQTTRDMIARTDGLFDPTLLPVIQLWGFSGGAIPDPLPTQEQIDAARTTPGLDHLVLATNMVFFEGNPSHIDPGGLAKGMAIDQAYDRIRTAFPQASFLLNLGGEMRVYGQAEPDRPWRIGVQHPLVREAYVGVIDTPSGWSVATSGHYERYFERDGIRYAHIIDPSTGRPVTGMAGVTVVCPDATVADALSTALFVAGIDRAHEILKNFPESHAILIPDREPLEIFLSPAINDLFEPLEEFAANLKTIPGLSTQDLRLP